MSCGIYETRPDMCRLDPKMPVHLQERWCKHQEKNWEVQVEEQEILRDIAIERG
ncbi:MAG: hypothetical protein KAS38_18170 [Anaerolineales bacterium]|nr:hypothetical protein [Anaerolineales bacterium]